MEISPQPLQLFTEAMHIMTTLNLAGVLRTYRYDGVLRAIALNMPSLKALDISQSNVKANAIECLLPTKEKPSSGCPDLIYLNLKKSKFVTVGLLKKIILRLPKLQYLKNALLMKTLAELTEKKMDVDTGRCLRYLYSDCRSQEKYFDVLTRSPVFTRLSNITEVDIVVKEESEIFLRDLLMQLKTVKRLTLSKMSNLQKFLLPALESHGESLEYLHLYYLSGDFNLGDITRICPRLEELTVHCNPDNESDMSNTQTSNDDHVLTCLRKVELLNMDKQICSQATLVSLLKSPCLEEIYCDSVEAMSNDVMFSYLLFLCEGSYVRFSIIKQIVLNCCPNITEEPFVHWLTMDDCMLEFIYIRGPDVNCKELKTAAEMYTKKLSLFAYRYYPL